MRSYLDILVPIIRGRRVLDVGSIAHNYENRSSYKVWNFDILRRYAQSLIGIDILATEVEKAQRDGYDIRLGDAESFLLANPVDVVLAGDIIEHLSNPGLFLACAWKNLVNNGHLVVVTPNTFCFSRIWRICSALTNDPPVNPEHTCYFTPRTLAELAHRHRFDVADVQYCNINYSFEKQPTRRRILLRVNAGLTALRPQLAQLFVAVLHKRIACLP
jgi:SAM-dependent methyltransferase